MGRSTMTKLAKIMKDEDISVATKTKLVYSLVLPVVTAKVGHYVRWISGD